MGYRSLALAAVAAAFITVDAQGQTCTGNANFSTGKYRGAGSIVFGDNVTTFGAAMTLGMPKWFWTGSLGTTSVSGGGSSTNFGVNGGYQVDQTLADTWHMCPGGGFSYSSFTNGHTTNIGLGGSIGSVVHESGGWQYIPTGTFTFQRTSVTTDFGGGSISASDTYEMLVVGFGFYRTESKVNLMPQLFLPIGLNGASSSFGGTVSIGFGSPAR